MESFVGLGKLLIFLIEAGILLAYLIALFIILVITMVYFCGYIYDSIVGNSPLKIGMWIIKKIPQVKKKKLICKAWDALQPKDIYLRYETPLCSYCFSYSSIAIIAEFAIDKYGIDIQYLIAASIYLTCYFIGMYRRCRENSEYYNSVLSNNLSFLKLSFVPITCLITLLGFWFTITGLNVQELNIDPDLLQHIITKIANVKGDTNFIITAFKLMQMGLLLLAMMYVISLPIQIVSYFVILVIQYFREHGKSYKELLRKYISIVKYLLKHCFV
jgi:hypothetical protein